LLLPKGVLSGSPFTDVSSVVGMAVRPTLVEFPADEPERARRFWWSLLGVPLEGRTDEEGSGWQTHGPEPHVGVHERGLGPGDTASLPYFAAADLDEALERVKELGGSVIHRGSRWAICRDSEGRPFGLALAGRPNP
jgi:predicted enzyme related to lactoylglutathione lyase